MSNKQELLIKLGSAIPECIATGTGTMLYLEGSCSHPSQSLRRLEVVLGQQTCPVLAHSVFDSDLPPKSSPPHVSDQGMKAYFWALIQIPEVSAQVNAELGLRAKLTDGAIIQQRIANIRLVRSRLIAALPFEAIPAVGPLVTICMATHNPSLTLFRRQIQSIREQTYQNWICVISDDASQPERLAEIRQIIAEDARFLLSPAPERLGVFRNFERSLMLAPAHAAYLALADQDDDWYPEKLQTLLAQFDRKTTLVYSDMRVVKEGGEVISESYWKLRENNYRDFTSLLLANTITGAASIIDGRLRDRILPFPPLIGTLFHDHWIACVARAHGKVKYVNRPLYDYVQHGGNVLGYYDAPYQTPHKLYKVIYWMFLEIIKTSQGRQRARAIYFENVLPVMMLAKVILLRGHSELRHSNARVLRRFARLDRSFRSIVWLFWHGLKNRRPRCPTLGAEYHLLQGVFWKLYTDFKSRR